MVLFVVRSLESLLDCDWEVSGKDVIPDTVGWSGLSGTISLVQLSSSDSGSGLLCSMWLYMGSPAAPQEYLRHLEQKSKREENFKGCTKTFKFACMQYLCAIQMDCQFFCPSWAIADMQISKIRFSCNTLYFCLTCNFWMYILPYIKENTRIKPYQHDNKKNDHLFCGH